MAQTLIYWKQGIPVVARTVMLHYMKFDAPAVELANAALQNGLLRADRPLNVEQLLFCGKQMRLCNNERTVRAGLRAGPFFERLHGYGGKREGYIQLFAWRGVEASLSSLPEAVKLVMENMNLEAEAIETEVEHVQEMLQGAQDAASSPLIGDYPLRSLPAYRLAFLRGFARAHQGLSARQYADVLGCERSVGLRMLQRLEDKGEITRTTTC